jgi:NAD(P)-dependent dehydrogenase (short-subunit alcohol dehydrogenase family)
MIRSLAVIVGAGAEAGIGGATALKAAAEGCDVAIVGRTPAKLEKLAEPIRAHGVEAHIIVADVTDGDAVKAMFKTIDALDGTLDFVVHNVGNMFSGASLEVSQSYMEEAWRTCCLSGFLVGREAARRMADKGRGSLFFTGATASTRAKPGFVPFATAKMALRGVAEGLAREFWPKGVHVAHLIVDGIVAGDLVKDRNPELSANLDQTTALDPAAIAETYWALHRQPPTAWSFEVDVRPCGGQF